MIRLFLFFGFWWLCAISPAAAQDSSRPALSAPTQQVSPDSATLKPAPAQSAAEKNHNDTMISLKDLISWIIDFLPTLIAVISGLLLVGYLAHKRRKAELRAEYEFKKRTELEERQRKVEEQLVLLTANRQFAKKKEQEEKTQKNKTAEERYRYMLENEVCQIHLAAPGVEGMAVNLIDTFVHLNISEQYRSAEFPLWGETGRERSEHEDLKPEEVVRRAFQEDRRKLLVIIGDPGSGKTTLLKYYAMCCLQPEGHRKLGFTRPVFPMYLPLREVDPNQSLADNLSRWAMKHDPLIPPEEFHAWLDERDTLVLLDGLDEVSKLEERRQVCAWIDNKCAGLKRARFIFTSRSTGMRIGDNLVLCTSHLHAEVRDFSHEQKQEFLRKWFRAAHLEGSRPRKDESPEDWKERQLREAEKNAAEVIAYLDQKENRSLRELAGIPMLLQLLALIWKQYKTKPESRTKLYDVALDYLLEFRDDQRGLAPLLKADKARRVLNPVALWMQEKLGTEEVAKDKMHDFVRPILQPIDNTLKAEDLCENLRNRAGLIADYGKNEYIFRHKSFREYFAGLQLAANYGENGRLARLVKTFGDPAWAEPLRYFMSKADHKAFNAFMSALFASPASHELSQEKQDLLQLLVREAAEKPLDALLACVNDPAKNEKQQRYALDCLKTIAGEPVRENLAVIVRKNVGASATLAYAREIVAQLEKPRLKIAMRAVMPALFEQLQPSFRNPVEDNAEYILIRGGTIKYSKTGKIEKVSDLYFAKYPVTNKQYRRFILYLQGEEMDLLKQVSSELFERKLSELMVEPALTSNKIAQFQKSWSRGLISLYDDDRRFNSDDQPVVGVDWFAARSYCFWLSLLEVSDYSEHDASFLDASAQRLAGLYRLPQEIEWERAAAGRREDGPPRKYPWPQEKGEPSEKIANYRGKVGQTTAVGRYPEGATPEGLMDMAGNVWEWQENLYDENKVARALRGGSWDLNTGYLPCAIRDGEDPDYGGNSIGFRVVRAQSAFDTL